MTSPPMSPAVITSVSSAVGDVQSDRSARRAFDLPCPQQGRSSTVSTLNRADRLLVAPAGKQSRILLVDAALTMRALHRMLPRMIPAVVENLSSCLNMYHHEKGAYELVILALHSKSSETAEAAHFVRRRWSASKILLLESESAAIDDWLYDERVDPYSHPVTVCETAIRLIAGERHRIPPLYKGRAMASRPTGEVSRPKGIADVSFDPDGTRLSDRESTARGRRCSGGPVIARSSLPGSAERRLQDLGIRLPAVPKPFGSYVEAVQTGNLLFLSGMLPVVDHKPKYIGRLGKELDVEMGRDAVRTAALESPIGDR